MMGRLYSDALRLGHPLESVSPDGSRSVVPVDDWRGPCLDGDADLIARCVGSTLDVGCGPGRLVIALLRQGIGALGIDVNGDAVQIARRAGARVELCSVFADVPGAGSWDTVLLADGNIGIGGTPVVLLRRVAALLAPGGRALVEVAGPECASGPVQLRLAAEGRVSRPFPWATLSLADTATAAAQSGLHIVESWSSAGRWFVSLGRG